MQFDSKLGMQKSYTDLYCIRDIKRLYPDEYLVRIFKGKYPKLDLCNDELKGKKLCDVGFGDGRNFPLFNEVGLNLSGTEITKEIVDHVKLNLLNMNIQADLKVGFNGGLPFDNSSFDFVVSWNSAYYMQNNHNLYDSFLNYIKEFARILKNDGRLIMSFPMKSHCIYNDSIDIEDGFKILKNDPYYIRNGQIFKYFNNENELEEMFSPWFEKFVFAKRINDCFGLKNDWYVVVATRKG